MHGHAISGPSPSWLGAPHTNLHAHALLPHAGAPCTWAATRPRGQGRAATVAPSAAANASAAYSSAAPSAPRVCILGGGFGGLYTAIKLESLMWPRGSKPQVTLIDQGKRFVFKPLLYELLNSTASADEVAPTFAQLLAPYPIQFVQVCKGLGAGLALPYGASFIALRRPGREVSSQAARPLPPLPHPWRCLLHTAFPPTQAKVAGVELEERLQDGGSASGGRVLLSNGDSVEYDWLVVSLGAEADPRGVPGVQELARKFTAYEDAVAVSEKLAELEVGPYAPVVVVVGAGYAGVELAAVVAERLKGRGVVKVVTPGASILESSPPGQQEAARKVRCVHSWWGGGPRGRFCGWHVGLEHQQLTRASLRAPCMPQSSSYQLAGCAVCPSRCFRCWRGRVWRWSRARWSASSRPRMAARPQSRQRG